MSFTTPAVVLEKLLIATPNIPCETLSEECDQQADFLVIMREPHTIARRRVCTGHLRKWYRVLEAEKVPRSHFEVYPI